MLSRSATGAFLALLTILATLSLPARAASSHAATAQVKAQLIAAVDAVHPGEEILLGIRQQIAPHWHTYWINPGDSGIATRIDWKLPAGAVAGDILWPVPERLQLGPVTNFAYSDEVTLLVTIRIPADARPGSSLPLQATVDWLVCREECIPQQVELGLTLPVIGAATARRENNPLISAARARLPLPSPWPVRFETGKTQALLRIATGQPPPTRIHDIRFYPAQWGNIAHAAEQRWQTGQDELLLQLTTGEAPVLAGEALSGLLLLSEEGNNGTQTQAFAVNAIATDSPPAAASTIGLPAALLLALLGGVILNLMPCVFPVLSIKALSLLQHARHSPRETRRQGLAYTLGILVSFTLLGTLLIALKAGGAQIGWGFQFQSPAFVLIVAYLVFAVGLSLSGVFELGSSVTGIGASLAERPGYAGSFFTGVLATVVATPCTAPFMAAAVGFALTQPAASLLAIFLSLGLGLALPYLLLSTWPALQRRLPRPGPWMERGKQFLAFPMYAAALWLLWVLARQLGPDSITLALGGMLLIAFAAWLYGSTRRGGHLARHGSASLATLAVAGAIIAGLSGIGPSNACAASEQLPGNVERAWQAYDPDRLTELRRSGRPVFLNLTADWCISCLVNERVALGDESVTAAFHQAGITYLKGDWTRKDAAITAKLAEFGRSGVPLYVYYPPGAASSPVILPQILTPEIVLGAVSPHS